MGTVHFPSLQLLIWEVGFVIFHFSILSENIAVPRKFPHEWRYMDITPGIWMHIRGRKTSVSSGVIAFYLNTSLSLLCWWLPEDERAAFRTHWVPVTINKCFHTAWTASVYVTNWWPLAFLLMQPCLKLHISWCIPPTHTHTRAAHSSSTSVMSVNAGSLVEMTTHTHSTIYSHSTRISTRLQPVTAGWEANSFCSATNINDTQRLHKSTQTKAKWIFHHLSHTSNYSPWLTAELANIE